MPSKLLVLVITLLTVIVITVFIIHTNELVRYGFPLDLIRHGVQCNSSSMLYRTNDMIYLNLTSCDKSISSERKISHGEDFMLKYIEPWDG